MMNELIRHYDSLIDEGNDPVYDPKPLRDYMDKWDGRPFIDAMCLDRRKTVLEIGIGTGRLAVRVAPLCKRFYGIDISPKTVARAAENLRTYQHVQLICDDFLSHGFSEQFDVIYSSLTFMHIKDKPRAMNKIFSLLKENGLFVLSIDKNQSDFIDMGSRKIKIYPDSPCSIRTCIANAGLALTDEFETEFAHVFAGQRCKACT